MYVKVCASSLTALEVGRWIPPATRLTKSTPDGHSRRNDVISLVPLVRSRFIMIGRKILNRYNIQRHKLVNIKRKTYNVRTRIKNVINAATTATTNNTRRNIPIVFIFDIAVNALNKG